MNSLLKYVRIFSLFSFILLKAATSVAAPSPGVKEQGSKVAAPHVFAVIPFYSPEKIWTFYSPFVEYLRKSTGQSWELKLFNTHDEVLEGICDGRISVALLGPVPLGRASVRCDVKPLLVALGKDGKPFYHSMILSNDPSVTTLRGLKGRKVGFFKGSTAAHIMPAKMLKDAGLDMGAIQPIFLESQDRMISALFSGEIAAAGVKQTLALKFSNDKLHAIATSPQLPNFALCATPTLPGRIREGLVAALSRMKPMANERDAEITKDWDDEIKNGFVLPDKRYLPSVLKIHAIFREIQHEN
jgi:phosphonate transport system substrate-binding protein